MKPRDGMKDAYIDGKHLEGDTVAVDPDHWN
jgi:hypothetical protein